MTQLVRQKWVLLVASLNALLALALMAVVAVGLSSGQRSAREAAARREAELREVRSELERLHGLPAAIEELRVDGLRRATIAPVDPQLTQTLQLVASEQQLLLLRSMEQSRPPAPIASHRTAQRSARRAPGRTSRRARRLQKAGCAVTQ